jgi:hypothetical protein
MFRRGLALEVFIVTVSCTAGFASSAAATPPHLLPLKACKFVMTGADFDDGLAQVYRNQTVSGAGETDEGSQCEYASTEADGPGVSHEFPEIPLHPHMNNGLESEESLIGECEVYGKKPLAKEPPEPPAAPETGGCYSLVQTSVEIGVGPKVEALLRHAGGNPRNYRDKGAWPPGATRSVLHTFGAYADAEIGYATVPGPLGSYELAYGYLHVKNAQITIEERTSPPRAPTSMLTLLDDAKSTL